MAERFSGALKNVYDFVYLLKLKTVLLSHAKALSSVVNIKDALKAWSFKSYEESVYFRMYNHTTNPTANGQVVNSAPAPTPAHSPSPTASALEDYWERNNPIRDVDDIAVPVLCINSLDDPVCSGESIPYDLFRCYPNFLLVVTEKGGNCGFLEGFPLKSWADSLCLDYLEAVFECTTRGYTRTTTTTSSHSASNTTNARHTIRSTI